VVLIIAVTVWVIPRSPIREVRRRKRRLLRSTRGYALVYVLIILLAAGDASWNAVLPAKVANATSALHLARHLRSETEGSCDHNSVDLGTVDSLMSAKSICVFGTGSHRFVEFIGAEVPAPGVPGDLVQRGLLYSPSGVNSKWTPDLCVRHINGYWWSYQQLLLSCPFGLSAIGAA
jgi:hypothetical protein